MSVYVPSLLSHRVPVPWLEKQTGLIELVNCF